VVTTYAPILPIEAAFSQCVDRYAQLDENFTREQLKAKLAGLPMPPAPVHVIPPTPLPPSPTPTPRPPTPTYGWIVPNTEARAGEPCGCTGGPTFWQLAQGAPGVVVAQVTRHLSVSSPAEAVEARVIEVVRGTETRTTLTFPAPHSSTCTVGALSFPVGTTYAFILPAQAGLWQCMQRWILIDEKLTIEQLRKQLGRQMK
jgi:hypothetical protein